MTNNTYPYFPKIDFAEGFLQIRLATIHLEYTAFYIETILYRLIWLLLRICNRPAGYISLVSDVSGTEFHPSIF